MWRGEGSNDVFAPQLQRIHKLKTGKFGLVDSRDLLWIVWRERRVFFRKRSVETGEVKNVRERRLEGRPNLAQFELQSVARGCAAAAADGRHSPLASRSTRRSAAL